MGRSGVGGSQTPLRTFLRLLGFSGFWALLMAGEIPTPANQTKESGAGELSGKESGTEFAKPFRLGYLVEVAEKAGGEKPININIFSGLSREWVGRQIRLCVSFLLEQKGNT